MLGKWTPSVDGWKRYKRTALLLFTVLCESVEGSSLGMTPWQCECRLDGSYGRETANAGAVEEIRSTAVACLGELQAAFGEAMAAQQQRSSQVGAALKAYMERKTSDLAALQVRAACLHVHSLHVDTITSVDELSQHKLLRACEAADQIPISTHTGFFP